MTTLHKLKVRARLPDPPVTAPRTFAEANRHALVAVTRRNLAGTVSPRSMAEVGLRGGIYDPDHAERIVASRVDKIIGWTAGFGVLFAAIEVLWRMVLS